ncbi:MAG TPA: GNAT family N-acetyltransferase [Brevibacterium senegalense]|uniref:GNAT family N-acetyltransferase n=1 Tax=Brevibacterium senegalense TaxID=1033736 RepID=A0A921MD71_9MICO|nr:GNAT family N-acetyltransferase [Brevibacterium senegalense]
MTTPGECRGPFRPMPQALSTDRLRLRRWSPDDRRAVRNLWRERDPRVPARRRIDAQDRPTEAQVGASIATQVEESARTGLQMYAVELRAAPGVIGYCGLSIGDATEAEPEIVFELARSVHGRGFATEAAIAVRDAGRDTGRSRLWASVREWNTASFRVLSKLGFTDSGRRDPDPFHGDIVWTTLGPDDPSTG